VNQANNRFFVKFNVPWRQSLRPWAGGIFIDKSRIFAYDAFTMSCRCGIFRAVLFCFSSAAFLALPAAEADSLPVNYTPLQTYTSRPVGNQPLSVLWGPDGILYGVTYSGGPANGGTVFKMNPDGSGYSMLQFFAPFQTGNSNQAAQAISDLEGPSLFGQAPLLGGLTLTMGNDGYLYGTTFYGSTNGGGTVFRMSRSPGPLSTVCDFSSSPGIHPVNVIQAKDGSLVGTTWDGKVFLVSSDGGGYTLTASVFDGFCSSLIQGSDGYFYATAVNDQGTVLKFIYEAELGTIGYRVLTNLTTAGLANATSLIQGSDGYLYLTAGISTVKGAGEAVCQMSTNGTGLTVLHLFTNSPDGSIPTSLVQGLDNVLYGTTLEGGTNNDGTFFEIGLGGTNYNVLYSFGSTNAYPMGGLAAGAVAGVGGVVYGSAIQSATKLPYSGQVFGLTVNPPLSISSPTPLELGGNQFDLYWPAWATGYTLQYSTSLTSSEWKPLGLGPPQMGTENGEPVQYVRVGISLTAPPQYYRIAH
jgi:uncharacterized repeat protein (TIGR03803 family)